MSRLTAILKSKQKFPKPETNWSFGDFSKIQPGAGANDVAGWTGESLKTGTSTIDLTQTTAASQPVFDTDHIVFDGSDYLEGLPIQSGDFTYIMDFSSTSGVNQALMGNNSDNDEFFVLIGTDFRIKSSTALVTDFPFIFDSTGRHVIAVTKSSTTWEVFIDGVSSGSFTDAGTLPFTRLGVRFNSLHFIGNMYNTLIYPVALTSVEVAAKTASLA